MPTAERIAVNRANPQESTSSGNPFGQGHIPFHRPEGMKWGGPMACQSRNPNIAKPLPGSQLRSATFKSKPLAPPNHQSAVSQPARPGTPQIATQSTQFRMGLFPHRGAPQPAKFATQTFQTNFQLLSFVPPIRRPTLPHPRQIPATRQQFAAKSRLPR
jgi:hypothetical protein